MSNYQAAAVAELGDLISKVEVLGKQIAQTKASLLRGDFLAAHIDAVVLAQCVRSLDHPATMVRAAALEAAKEFRVGA